MSHRSEQGQKQSSESKQKVTLYLSPELHRNLKIRAAVDMEAMSVMAEKALHFYLTHSDLIEGKLGQAYQVHHCPACSHPLIMRDGELASLPSQASGRAVLDDSAAEFSHSDWSTSTSEVQEEHPREDELVPC